MLFFSLYLIMPKLILTWGWQQSTSVDLSCFQAFLRGTSTSVILMPASLCWVLSLKDVLCLMFCVPSKGSEILSSITENKYFCLVSALSSSLTATATWYTSFISVTIVQMFNKQVLSANSMPSSKEDACGGGEMLTWATINLSPWVMFNLVAELHRMGER